MVAKIPKEETGGNVMNEKIFPTILIILDVLAALPYIAQHNLSMSVYWLAAAVLTLSVTWL